MNRTSFKYLLVYFLSVFIMVGGIVYLVKDHIPNEYIGDENIQLINKSPPQDIIQSSGKCINKNGDTCFEKAGESSQPVRVGYHVNKVNTYHSGNERSFYADFYVWFGWPGEVGSYMPFEFMNSFSRPEIIDETAENQECVVKVNDDLVSCYDIQNENLTKLYYKVYRVRGDFMYNLNLKSYPFDHQELNVELELSQHLYDKAYLVADTNTHIPERLKISGWVKGKSKVETEAIGYKTNFGIYQHESSKTLYYARSTLSIDITRNPLPYVLKTLAPLLIIIFIGSLALFLNPSDVGTRLGLTTGALLTAIALHITVSSSLPNVGLLTIMDRFFINGYLHIWAVTAETIIVGKLCLNNEKFAQRIDRICYILFPLTFLVGFYFAIII